MGFRECTPCAECRTGATMGFAPIPTAHAHIDRARFVGFHKKSDTLWSIPCLQAGCKRNNSRPDIITASDVALPGPRPGRCRGAFSRALYPVHIPSAHRLTGAFILLSLRDFDPPLVFFWRAMLTYMVDFLVDDGIFDTRDLEPHPDGPRSFLKTPAMWGWGTPLTIGGINTSFSNQN